MEIIVSSHIIAAALQVIGVGDVASAFNLTVPHHQLHSSLDSVLEAIVSQYINLSCVVGSIFYLYLKLQDTKTTVLRHCTVIEVIKSRRKVELRNTTTFHFQKARR